MKRDKVSGWIFGCGLAALVLFVLVPFIHHLLISIYHVAKATL